MKIVREGFKYARKRFTPPKSPEGFAWPTKPTAEDKRALAASIQKLAEARGMDHMDLAKAITGEVVNAAGFQTARDAYTIRLWWHGKKFPRESAAIILATYFDVSLQKLLGRANGSGTNGHANGHAHAVSGSAIKVKAKKGKKGAPPQPQPPTTPVALPEGATPAFVKLETFPDDPRFVSVFVTGTMPIDQALSVMALLDPRHGSDSRK